MNKIVLVLNIEKSCEFSKPENMAQSNALLLEVFSKQVSSILIQYSFNLNATVSNSRWRLLWANVFMVNIAAHDLADGIEIIFVYSYILAMPL